MLFIEQTVYRLPYHVSRTLRLRRFLFAGG